MLAALFWADRWGRDRALHDVQQQALTDADLKLALLLAALERPRALPLVLSKDTDLQAVLAGPRADEVTRLNVKLESLVSDTQAAVIYVIGRDGVTIAASNWREPTSFIGSDYSFRDYVRLAMANGEAEQYALGNVSKRPGLYLSRRVSAEDGAVLGVVVVKVEFDRLEASWSGAARPTYVVDHHGIVLMTSIPSWRFMSTSAIPAGDRAEIRDSLQFGDASLDPLPFDVKTRIDDRLDIVGAILPGDIGKVDYLRAVLPAPGTGWFLSQLSPLEPSLTKGGRESRLLAMAALLPLLALGALVLARRQRTLKKIAATRESSLELERRVVERTRDLTVVRDRLQQEISDHHTTEGRLQTVQQELVQANRLAILGQVAAGVAHEINQPVATIRAYADNARTFLDRGQARQASENMETIAGLTERIGFITDELKAFARKGRTSPGPTGLHDIMSGAVMLLRSRFSGRMDRLQIEFPPVALKVVGSRIRLEQVLINLLQNALEAIADQKTGAVTVDVLEDGDRVSLRVCDNGPGLSPDIREALFTPFNTSKEAGLGLGLVISKEIVTDYGGSIDVDSRPGRTCFIVQLKKAMG